MRILHKTGSFDSIAWTIEVGAVFFDTSVPYAYNIATHACFRYIRCDFVFAFRKPRVFWWMVGDWWLASAVGSARWLVIAGWCLAASAAYGEQSTSFQKKQLNSMR